MTKRTTHRHFRFMRQARRFMRQTRRFVIQTGQSVCRGAPISLLLAGLVAATPATAQNSGQSTWSTGTQVAPKNTPAPTLPFNTTTVLPRQPAPIVPGTRAGIITLEAFLTDEGKTTARLPIDRGLVWRVFTLSGENEPAKLVMTRRDPTPTIKLPAGQYAINAAFGRAHLTQIIKVALGQRQKEPFVLNAGGLRVIVKVAGGTKVGKGKARYDIYSDERDQSGARRRVVTNARPGLITRLNSGIYHIVSRLGDANALVSAEVAIEAGKLTEAVVSHEAAKVTFKLVQSTAGEAIADTQWIIMTKTGDIIKETAGALPSHVLAPGSYNVSARWSGKLFSRTFEIQTGDNVEVEVLMQ